MIQPENFQVRLGQRFSPQQTSLQQFPTAVIIVINISK